MDFKLNGRDLEGRIQEAKDGVNMFLTFVSLA